MFDFSLKSYELALILLNLTFLTSFVLYIVYRYFYRSSWRTRTVKVLKTDLEQIYEHNGKAVYIIKENSLLKSKKWLDIQAKIKDVELNLSRYDRESILNQMIQILNTDAAINRVDLSTLVEYMRYMDTVDFDRQLMLNLALSLIVVEGEDVNIHSSDFDDLKLEIIKSDEMFFFQLAVLFTSKREKISQKVLKDFLEIRQKRVDQYKRFISKKIKV